MTDEELQSHRDQFKAEAQAVYQYDWDICGDGIITARQIIAELDARIAKLTKPISATPLRLPLPPSVNHYWMPNGRGGKLLSGAGKAFMGEAMIAARNQGYDYDLTTNLFVNIHHYQHSGDSDNRVKPLFDSLNGIVWRDDKIITKHTVEIHRIGRKEEQYTLLDVFER